MNKVSGTAFYQYNGPSVENPLRTELTEEELCRTLHTLNSDLTHYFPSSAKISTEEPDLKNKQVKFSVEINSDRESIIRDLEVIFRNADLYGRLDK